MDNIKDKILTQERLLEILALEDFTLLESEVHPVNLVMNIMYLNLQHIGIYGQPEVRRGSPITTTDRNFDALLFPPESIMRTGLHTFTLEDGRILRTQMSYMLPEIISEGTDTTRIIMCPGLVYRKEGPHHEMDIWLIKRSAEPFIESDVRTMLAHTLNGLVDPTDIEYRDKTLYYIHDGCRIKVHYHGKAQTFASGGVVNPEVLAMAGLDPNQYQAIALGVSLDRIAMYKKGIDDPRVLRSQDQRIRVQMSDLEDYNQISKFPSIQRDISIVVGNSISMNDLLLYLRFNLPQDILDAIEDLEIVSETSYADLPETARERLGITVNEKNILVRFNIRSFEKTLTKAEANKVREAVYIALNKLNLDDLDRYSRLVQES